MAAELETRVLRKVTWRIVPFVMVLYFVSYLDRVNIGFAALTMNKQLGLSPAAFGFGAAIFFIGYFLFELPSNLILHKIGARIWIARVMITWGLVSAGMALVKGPTSFYVLRFLLGLAVAGFFPGVILYLGYWFPARKRAAMIAVFMAAIPLSTALGSPISAALVGMHPKLGLVGWQWMFIAEAVPAVLLGVAVLFALTDRPEKAAWLAEDERAWLVDTLAAEEAALGAGAHRSVWRGLADIRVLALSLIYFGTTAGLYTVGIWSPQIFHDLGQTVAQVGTLSAIPAILSVLAMVAWAWHSDRTNERTWHVVIACLFTAAGFVMAGLSVTVLTVVASLTIVNIGVNASKPPLWSMPTLFLSGPAAAAGIAAINAIGNLGGFVGPWMIGWIKERTGSYEGGLYFVGGLMAFSAVLTLILARSQSRPRAAAAVAGPA